MKSKLITVCLSSLFACAAMAQVGFVSTSFDLYHDEEVMKKFWQAIDETLSAQGVPEGEWRLPARILACLNVSRTYVSHFKYATNRSLQVLSFGAYDKHQNFAVTSGWMTGLPVSHEGTLYFVGISLEIAAEGAVGDRAVKFNGIFGVAAEAQANRVTGQLRVQTQGIGGQIITNNTQSIQQITEEGVFEIVQGFAVIKSHLFDDGITISPRIVGYASNSLVFGELTDPAFLDELQIKPNIVKVADILKTGGSKGG
jgi:hypothetical protein